MAAQHTEREHSLVPQSLYVKIWGVLLVMTAVTVSVSYVDMKNVKVLTAMLIAAVKSALVVLYFMHIRFEKPVFALFVVIVLGIYAVTIALTFTDYLYR